MEIYPTNKTVKLSIVLRLEIYPIKKRIRVQFPLQCHQNLFTSMFLSSSPSLDCLLKLAPKQNGANTASTALHPASNNNSNRFPSQQVQIKFPMIWKLKRFNKCKRMPLSPTPTAVTTRNIFTGEIEYRSRILHILPDTVARHFCLLIAFAYIELRKNIITRRKAT